MSRRTGGMTISKRIKRILSGIGTRGVRLFRRARTLVRPSMPIAYALALEAIELSLFGFAAVLTIEAIVPGIIPGTVDLVGSFIGILTVLGIVFLLGHRFGFPFVFAPSRKNPLTWVGISWLAFLFTFSIVGSRFRILPIVLFLYLVTGLHIFRRKIFRNDFKKILAQRFGRG